MTDFGILSDAIETILDEIDETDCKLGARVGLKGALLSIELNTKTITRRIMDEIRAAWPEEASSE